MDFISFCIYETSSISWSFWQGYIKHMKSLILDSFYHMLISQHCKKIRVLLWILLQKMPLNVGGIVYDIGEELQPIKLQ